MAAFGGSEFTSRFHKDFGILPEHATSDDATLLGSDTQDRCKVYHEWLAKVASVMLNARYRAVIVSTLH